jgi:hypothetical protein
MPCAGCAKRSAAMRKSSHLTTSNLSRMAAYKSTKHPYIDEIQELQKVSESISRGYFTIEGLNAALLKTKDSVLNSDIKTTLNIKAFAAKIDEFVGISDPINSVQANKITAAITGVLVTATEIP